MLDYFVFPVNFNDIQQESLSLNRHRATIIDLAIAEREILRKLKSIDSSFFQDYDIITDPDNFDFMYSLIKCFGDNIEGKSMKVLQELSSSIEYITQQMLTHLENLSEESNASKLRMAFKMVMFLCLYFTSVTHLKKPKSGQGDIITDAINREKGKKKPRSDQFELSKIILQKQKKCIQLIRQSLKINFVLLWQKKQIDTQFFKKYIDVCIKILESTQVKDEEITQCIFDIIESILNANYCQALGSTFQTVLANLVYEGDVIDNLIHFFAKAQGPQLQKLCTQALTLVVLYLVNKQGLNSQSQSIKNTKQFLSRLSQKIPKIFYTNLSCFIILFQHESYYLRNAIGDIMMNVLKTVLAGPQGEDIYKQSKQKYISTLLQRIYDKNSFCRSHILGILTQLTVEKAISSKYLILFMKAGIDRIKDQSINARRKALQLINAVVDQICTNKEIKPMSDIQREIEMAELQLKTLSEEEQRLKGQIDQVDDQDKLQELVTQVKLIKKRIKMTQERQMNLFEDKQCTNLINRAIDSIKMLLGSKTDTDVLETIKLFIKIYKFGFEKAKQSLPDIRILIFSKQKKIKDEVLNNFIYLHLNNKSEEVAKELISLFTKATPQDRSALQQIVETIVSESLIKNIVIIKPQAYAHMWNMFINYQRNQSNTSQKRAIITILRIVFSKNQSLIKQQNLQSFLNILKAYVQNKQPDFHIVKQISKIICLDDPNICRTAKHFILALMYILVNAQGESNNQWFSTCECIFTCIYKICDRPQKLSQSLLKKMSDKLEATKDIKSLCHFIFALSHNCLKILIYLDSLQNKIKSSNQKKMMMDSDNNQEQLDKVMGGTEAEMERQIEEIQMFLEKMIYDPLISRWINIIQKIVLNFKQGNELQIISVLAYTKFMLCSSSFCQQKFPHIIKLISKDLVNSVVKNNIIIAMGDLLHRFPNVIQPYNKYLYQNLHDRDPRVRKTTLTVITHLSLNDMIKVKSDMCDVALLFQDPDSQIQSLVKQFFHEMNKKDPKTLFNLIPDALIRFSNVQKQGNQSTFKTFLQNILPMLQKDKYSQSLIVKLCERLSNSLNLLEIANTAYCISQINVNEKGLRRIIQNFQTYRKTLQNPDVLQSFKNLITKLKKTQKSQIKSLIQELEEKVSHSGEQVFNADQIKRRNIQKLNKKQPKKKMNQQVGAGANNTNRRPAKKRRQAMDEQDDQQIMQIEQNPSQQVSNRIRNPRTIRRMRIVEESEELQEERDNDQNFID